MKKKMKKQENPKARRREKGEKAADKNVVEKKNVNAVKTKKRVNENKILQFQMSNITADQHDDINTTLY